MMIQQEITLEGVAIPDIVLFECEDQDVDVVDGKIYLKLDDRKELMSITSTEGLEKRLTDIGSTIDNQYLRVVGKTPSVDVHIYQYKSNFFIEFDVEHKMAALARMATHLVEQLIAESWEPVVDK
jgi:hypothetical protein